MKYLRWLVSFPISISIKFLTWTLAPILALPIFITKIDGREWLIPSVRYFQTHDAPVDEWYKFTYWKSCNWLVWDFSKATHRYLARYFWICRNPAYGFGYHIFGVTPTQTKVVKGSVGKWDTGVSNWEFTNWGSAFNLRVQWFFTTNFYVRINIGWKAHTGFNKVMLATFIMIRKF
jgi:hypothetical protein